MDEFNTVKLNVEYDFPYKLKFVPTEKKLRAGNVTLQLGFEFHVCHLKSEERIFILDEQSTDKIRNLFQFCEEMEVKFHPGLIYYLAICANERVTDYAQCTVPMFKKCRRRKFYPWAFENPEGDDRKQIEVLS